MAIIIDVSVADAGRLETRLTGIRLRALFPWSGGRGTGWWMAHQVTTETELTDASLLASALRAASIAFRIEKRKVVMTQGEATATLDLRTGRVTGDVEVMDRRLGIVKQLYGEAKYRAECERQGITIEARTVDKDGSIVLMCSMGDRPRRRLRARTSAPAEPSKRSR